jgi:hypothetical protein
MRNGRAFATRTLALFALAAATAPLAAQEAMVSGTLVANGATLELPYAYVWPLANGFYDDSDPAWKLLFVEHPVAPQDLGGYIADTAWVEIGITRTAELGDQPELQVYSQSIKLSADAGGNLSGGDYPTLALRQTGPDRFAGRVHHAEPQTIFDDTFQYDFTFELPLSDPDAPVGEPLPADGGEPGRAYLAWVAAIHAGDVAALQALVPAELGEQLDGEDGREQIEMMRELTPTDVTISSGSVDGDTAYLQIEGLLAGERAPGEITLTRMGEHWIPTKASW